MQHLEDLQTKSHDIQRHSNLILTLEKYALHIMARVIKCSA